MKHFLLSLFISTVSLSVSAEVTPAVIKIYDESEIEELLNAGVSIERRRGDIILCYLPYFDDEDIFVENNKGAKRRQIPNVSGHVSRQDFLKEHKNLEVILNRQPNRKKYNFNTPLLDKAVGYFEAFHIQEGKGLPSPFTGKGVVVGICDIGLDPLHPTFLDEEGKSRIKRITQYKEYDGLRIELEGEEAYKEWGTDDVEKYHATHVAGILAGSGAGTSYRGIAPDAEIVISLSNLTDFGLLMGVEDIIDYAREVGKPAVINLSMGNYVGPHDGSSLFSQYIDLCSEDAIIVLSSGNEGNRTNNISHTFSDDNKALQFRIGNRAWDQKVMYGMTDIWNSGDNPLTLTVCIFDDETHTIAYEYPPLTFTDWEETTYEWDPENPLLDGLTLNGFLKVTGGIDPENGRYEILILYNYESTRLIGSGWAKDMISFKLNGKQGDETDIFSDGTYTRLMGISGNPAPGSHLSISDLACGFKSISVGMYGDRENYPMTLFDSEGNNIGTEFISTGCDPLETVVHSSYGKLRDGRILPLTIAPGMPLMSSVSLHYLENNDDKDYFVAENGSLWKSCGGTSMSSPYVAGYIATWLEALPDLDYSDVMHMIAASNSHDIPEPDNPRNLNGYFNPLLALRHALDPDGIGTIRNPSALLAPSDHIEVFTTSGVKIYSGRLDGFEHSHKGIYIFRTPFGNMKKAL